MKKPSRVRIDWDTLEVVVDGPYEYRADLERCNTAPQVLDWIYQLGTKTWCTAEILKDFIDCLEDACAECFGNNFQGVLCPFGAPGYRVNWRTREQFLPDGRMISAEEAERTKKAVQSLRDRMQIVEPDQ